MPPHVAAFTDTYLPTVNGVSYTLTAWRDRWAERGGRMDVVFPRTDGYVPAEDEHPVWSLPFPFYDGFRVALPVVPDGLDGADVVHIHGPFTMGVAGLRLARRLDVPVVASYHTPTAQYADYVAPVDRLAGAVRRAANRYERLVYDRVDALLVPSERTRRHLAETRSFRTSLEVVPNGVDLEFFRPVDPSGFLDRYGIDADRPLVGYTGRHGYEKRLTELVDAAGDMDVRVVLGGDGPARGALERRAREVGADVRFLGFLDREELPELYSAVDVFAFPSPVETQGIVALEAFACGTPVVGADAGALSETVDHGETGYRYESGDVEALRGALRRALDDHEDLREGCLDSRADLGVGRAVSRLAAVYDELTA